MYCNTFGIIDLECGDYTIRGGLFSAAEPAVVTFQSRAEPVGNKATCACSPLFVGITMIVPKQLQMHCISFGLIDV